MNDEPTELEMKLLVLLLMHGGEMTAEEWWPLRRTVDPADTITQLKKKGLTDGPVGTIRISAKGRKVVEKGGHESA